MLSLRRRMLVLMKRRYKRSIAFKRNGKYTYEMSVLFLLTLALVFCLKSMMEKDDGTVVKNSIGEGLGDYRLKRYGLSDKDYVVRLRR